MTQRTDVHLVGSLTQIAGSTNAANPNGPAGNRQGACLKGLHVVLTALAAVSVGPQHWRSLATGRAGVADALVSLASRPRASTYIGAPARLPILAHGVAPNLMVGMMKWLTDKSLLPAGPLARSEGNVFEPSRGTDVGGFRSIRTRHRGAVALGAAAAGVGSLALIDAWTRRKKRGG